MAAIEIISPKKFNPIGQIPLCEIKINNAPTNNTVTITVGLERSNNPQFTGPVNMSLTNLKTFRVNTWQTVTNGFKPETIAGKYQFNVDVGTGRQPLFLRAFMSFGGTKVYSDIYPVSYANNLGIDHKAKLTNEFISAIKIDLDTEYIGNKSDITLTTRVSNNPFDSTPVWEVCPIGEWYYIKNIKCDRDFGIQVKLIGTKTNDTSGVIIRSLNYAFY